MTPIARLDYGATSVVSPWSEAVLPMYRSPTGSRHPNVQFAGTSRDDAIAAAHQLATHAVRVDVQAHGGDVRSVELNPAIAVLRDARAGTFWLTPLSTTIKVQDDWVEIPHSIDGIAFEGALPVLARPAVRSATQSMVALVGRDTVITPEHWADAGL